VKAHLITQANTSVVAYRGVCRYVSPHGFDSSKWRRAPRRDFESREMFPRQRVAEYVGKTPLACINVTAIFMPSESESGCGVGLVRQEEEEAVGEMCTVG
jgi:hypothetical protein